MREGLTNYIIAHANNYCAVDKCTDVTNELLRINS